MDIIQGYQLEMKNGEQLPLDEALQGIDLVAFYFGAGWCPPCLMFINSLGEVYKEAHKSDISLEVIYVSSDETDDDRLHYFRNHPCDWLALPWSGTAAEDLRKRFNVASIPILVVITREEGRLITADGRQQVQEQGTNVLQLWIQMFKEPPTTEEKTQPKLWE